MQETDRAVAPVDWTPLIVSLPQVPSLFQGSDNRYNLVYELFLQNYSRAPVSIERCDILDAKTNKVIKSFGAAEFAVMLKPITGMGSLIAAGEGADMFVNLDFATKGDAPTAFTHQIAYATKDPLGQSRHVLQDCLPTVVDPAQPVSIGPPLKGGRWMVTGGYASYQGHRDALFAVGNKLVSGQRYAIDWLRLDDKNRTSLPATTDPQSSPSYGVPIIAVADGVIVGTVDKFQDQLIGDSKEPQRYAYPGGNYIVQDLGAGNFGFYAHLKPGSLLVKAGQPVKRGQTIALLGNSGNTTGPHLHFHVMRGPEPLGAAGVPYAIDQFDVVGSVDLSGFVDEDIKGLPHSIVDSGVNGVHKSQLPKEGMLLNFVP